MAQVLQIIQPTPKIAHVWMAFMVLDVNLVNNRLKIPQTLTSNGREVLKIEALISEYLR